MTTRCPNRASFAVAVLALLACAAALPGCYQRVVGAKGLGAGAYDISEPYQENSKVDDWVFGEKQPNDKIIRPRQQPSE
ncbi:MAG TPA: hypothetical protein PKE29_11430 [Phycisphaerales bacterium]|nr:hypothetical protein [Phycisphaerales bacterium]